MSTNGNLVEIVECEECGMQGPKDEMGVCGWWIGTPKNGYACPDPICPECRGETEGDEN